MNARLPAIPQPTRTSPYSTAGALPVTTVAQMELDVERQIVTLPLPLQFLARRDQLKRRLSYARALGRTRDGGRLTDSEWEVLEAAERVQVTARPPVVIQEVFVGDPSRRRYLLRATIGTESYETGCTEEKLEFTQASFREQLDVRAFYEALEAISVVRESVDDVLARHGEWNLHSQFALHAGSYDSETKRNEDEEAERALRDRLSTAEAAASGPRYADEQDDIALDLSEGAEGP